MRYLALIVLFLSCASSKEIVESAAPIVPENATINIPGTSVNFQMAYIPGGTYQIGSPEEELYRNADEGPLTQVSVNPFWIGIHEVTYDEFYIYREKELDLPPAGRDDWDADAFARPSPPYEDPTFGMGEEGYPAVSMTQFSALQYCRWLSEKTGEFYRLPTEVEWEYACREGGKPSGYLHTESPESIEQHAWYYDNSMEKYQKVGQKEPNALGLYDMLGNVSEWTMDQYQDDAYATFASDLNEEVNPWIKPTRLHPRTVRGGSWDDDIKKQRCSCRIKSNMKWKERDPQIPKSFWWNTDSPFVGFRIVRPHDQPTKEEQLAFWELVLGG